MKIAIPLYGGGQILCDSNEEAQALGWIARISPYSIQQAYSLWDYFKNKYPKDDWEKTLQRTSAILYLCLISGQGVSTILEQMMKADMLGKPWPI